MDDKQLFDLHFFNRVIIMVDYVILKSKTLEKLLSHYYVSRLKMP